ncbi:hypothetical protein [Flavobacterium geliluteum]|uniref:Phage abortive infection protein n=1 Tax=Flavobacterium geliluteum TaxID=2816120 RepID=A0A940X875_9FLAO|nr:hypothetical protein [Flavobacterium geliluteum]MBP4137257.1 hypothetical protein [Flavobacterium geliluteum]
MTEQQNGRIVSIERQISKIDILITNYRTLAISIIVIGFLLIFVFYGILLGGNTNQNEIIDKLGSISGGVVSSSFSLAGLFLVYVAFLGQKQQILYQQIELIHNRYELELTRTEMSNQQLEMKKQNETLEIQKFENLFFQLLKNHNDIKKAFYYIMDLNLFAKFILAFSNHLPSSDGRDYEEETLHRSYRETLDSVSTFDYAFLYQINSLLKFVKLDGNQNINKEQYIQFVIQSLSLSERRCMFLICNYCTSINFEDKKYILECNVLNDINISNFEDFSGGVFFM